MVSPASLEALKYTSDDMDIHPKTVSIKKDVTDIVGTTSA